MNKILSEKRVKLTLKGLGLILIIFGILALTPSAHGAYPEKPITIIVHSKPGSGIDITSRQLAKIARKYSKATILVENKVGASGIIAMEEVLSRKNDGYTVMAVTKSFISTILLSDMGFTMDSFNMLACLVVDPEALITNRKGHIKTFDDLLQAARESDNSQRWLGPMVGGVDHLMAVQVWDKAGIKADWIPYEGGSDAAASLMGGNGDVYVGNPGDTKGRPVLQVAVIAARERLPEYPEVPTFIEKGINIPSEILWRGYALKQGTDKDVIDYLNNLFAQISNDSEWQTFIRSMAAQPVYYSHDQFTEMVAEDQHNAMKYLQMAGVLSVESEKQQVLIRTVGILAVLLLVILVYGFMRAGNSWYRGDNIIAATLSALSIFLFAVSLDFPSGKLGGVGPATLPRLVLILILLFSAWLIISNGRTKIANTSSAGTVKQPVQLILWTGLYLLLLQTMGYFMSTFIFIAGGVYLLKYRNHMIIFLASGGFVLLSYLAFYKVLGVPLPLGVFN